MKLYRRLSVLLLSMLLALAVAPLAAGQSSGSQVTVLFTHDLHSHLLPAAGEDGEPYGGYARLMSAIRAQRQTYPDALLLDGGTSPWAPSSRPPMPPLPWSCGP